MQNITLVLTSIDGYAATFPKGESKTKNKSTYKIGKQKGKAKVAKITLYT